MESGKFIRQVRQLKGLKQETVARRLGITQQAYSKIENANQIEKNTEKKILSAMQISEAEITKIKLIIGNMC
jgi:transcriptional regulator with XRE-family HTH domain